MTKLSPRYKLKCVSKKQEITIVSSAYKITKKEDTFYAISTWTNFSHLLVLIILSKKNFQLIRILVLSTMPCSLEKQTYNLALNNFFCCEKPSCAPIKYCLVAIFILWILKYKSWQKRMPPEQNQYIRSITLKVI